MADGECTKTCAFCSAWHSISVPGPKSLGYCARYALKKQAYEWCETWDDRRPPVA